MMRFAGLLAVSVLLEAAPAGPTASPSRPVEPGDAMIQAYLSRRAAQLDEAFAGTLPAAAQWDRVHAAWKQEYLYMLGLWPMPARSPLQLVVTGALRRDGYMVEKLHFQSLPGLYVTANLYRPADAPAGTKLPAVLYVCGHGHRGPEGVKSTYQSQPIWFARHGYVCLIVDTLDRGEIKGVHRGLYSEGRRWWLSRGYTPAGVECWNGIRAIDYLVGRPDVDPDRIAVTGISGGGAATFWIAAADDRVKAAVPVSGMADVQEYVARHGVDHHCDCMLLPNAFGWPWTRIAALVAPRPLLFVNSDNDRFFSMDANERVINRLERLYGILGAGDRVDAVVSVGEHAYRKDIRQAVYRFINMHLKGDAGVVGDSEEDLAGEDGDERAYPIDLKDLCVFPAGRGMPADAINATIDERFVPMAKVDLPAAGRFEAFKQRLVHELGRITFRSLPDRAPPARHLEDLSPTVAHLSSEDGVVFCLRTHPNDRPPGRNTVLLVSLDGAADPEEPPDWVVQAAGPDDLVAVCLPRGIGDTRWNTSSPPNRIEREHALIGRTVDTGRVWDVIAAARHLVRRRPGTSIRVAGEKAAGVLAAYAALLEPEIAGAIIGDPPVSHMDPAAPQFLNVLRVCDIPDVLGLLAPRPLTIVGQGADLQVLVKAIYVSAGAEKQLTFK